MNDSVKLSELLDQLVVGCQGSEEKCTIGCIMDRFSTRSYGPLLLLTSTMGLTPLGTIPMVPSVIGLFLFLLGFQLAIGKDSPWVPKFVREQGIKPETISKSVKKIKPWATYCEKFVRPRLKVFTSGVAPQLIGALCTVIAVLIPPLELVPLAALIPMTAIAIFSLALTTRDGVFVIIGSIVFFAGCLMASGCLS